MIEAMYAYGYVLRYTYTQTYIFMIMLMNAEWYPVPNTLFLCLLLTNDVGTAMPFLLR